MPPEKKDQKDDLIKSLRTYQGDVEEALHNNNFSASKVLIAEEERKREKPDLSTLEAPKNTEARNKFFLTLGGLLLVLGIITVSAVYYIKSQNQVAIVQKTKTILPFSQEKPIITTNLSIANIISTIVSLKQSFNLPLNSILYINLEKNEGAQESLENFLSILGPSMPASLKRSFVGKYMLGVYAFDSNTPFVILKTNDFSTSFAGMLKWESNMPYDLDKIFDLKENASSTNTFFDESIKNKDLRVMKDLAGKTIFLYSFIDKNTLVMTKTESVFSAILNKYLINQDVK
jgi:hypothetical protein